MVRRVAGRRDHPQRAEPLPCLQQSRGARGAFNQAAAQRCLRLRWLKVPLALEKIAGPGAEGNLGVR